MSRILRSMKKQAGLTKRIDFHKKSFQNHTETISSQTIQIYEGLDKILLMNIIS